MSTGHPDESLPSAQAAAEVVAAAESVAAQAAASGADVLQPAPGTEAADTIRWHRPKHAHRVPGSGRRSGGRHGAADHGIALDSVSGPAPMPPPPTQALPSAGAARPRQGVASLIAAQLADRNRWRRVRLSVDIVVLCVVAVLALLNGPGLGGDFSNKWLVAIFGAAVLAMMHWRATPDDRLNASAIETVSNVLGVSSLAAMVTLAMDSALRGEHPLALTTRLWLFSVFYLGGSRALLLTSRRHAMRHEGLATPTLIVGAGIIGAQLAHRLVEEPSYGMRPVGYLDADPMPQDSLARAPRLPVLGTPDDLEQAIASTGAQHVILSFSSGPDHALVATVRRCQQLRVGVSLVPRLYESITERTTLDHVGGLPLLTLNPIDPKGWQFAIKHALDRSLGSAGLLVLSPVMLGLAALVRVSSPGPVMFRQRRVGRDGREFDVLKFRTMRVAAPAPGDFVLPAGVAPGGVEGDDRRTWAGRWMRDLSLDELPQLINVMRGDMSLVGPRPERPDYVLRFSRDVARYEDRHRVKSGITGWAQVHGLRGQTSIADRVEWDNYYIQNWSLGLDLRILLMTLAEILRRRDSGSHPAPVASDRDGAPR